MRTESGLAATDRVVIMFFEMMVARDGVEPPTPAFSVPPELSIDSAPVSSESLLDSILFIGAEMEPSRKNLSLPRFASISTKARPLFRRQVQVHVTIL